MTRMALRGLLARKLRTALTGLRRRHRRRLRRRHVHLHRHDQRVVRRPVRARLEGRRRQRHRQAAGRGRLRRPDPAAPARDAREGRAVPGVDAAEPRFETEVTIFDKDGEPIGGNGPPSIVFSPDEERFDPLTYVEGEPADAVGEVTIDKATADRDDFHVGDKLKIAGRAPAKDYEIVGITKLGDQNSLGIVQHVDAARGGAADRRAAGRARPRSRSPRRTARHAGAAQGRRSRARSAAPPRCAPARSRPTSRRPTSATSLGFLTIALLVFAGVAVLVGGFLIFNTFAVTVAQRSREFALLRTLGASRRQVLSSVVVETLVIGFVASVLGILGGLAARAGAARAARVGRHRAALDGHRDRAADDHRRPRCRHDRDAGLRLRAGAARDAGGAGRGDARGGHARRRRPPPSGSSSPRRSIGARPARAARRPVRRRDGSAAASLLGLGVVVMMFGVALLAPVLVRPLARVIGAPLRARSRGCPAGSRARTPSASRSGPRSPPRR